MFSSSLLKDSQGMKLSTEISLDTFTLCFTSFSSVPRTCFSEVTTSAPQSNSPWWAAYTMALMVFMALYSPFSLSVGQTSWLTLTHRFWLEWWDVTSKLGYKKTGFHFGIVCIPQPLHFCPSLSVIPQVTVPWLSLDCSLSGNSKLEPPSYNCFQFPDPQKMWHRTCCYFKP